MPQRKKTNQSVTPSIPTRQWETDLTEGPKALYSHFIGHALDERMPELDTLDDATRLIVFDAVELAITVFAAAAMVAPTWEGLYAEVMRSIPKAKAA